MHVVPTPCTRCLPRDHHLATLVSGAFVYVNYWLTPRSFSCILRTGILQMPVSKRVLDVLYSVYLSLVGGVKVQRIAVVKFTMYKQM